MKIQGLRKSKIAIILILSLLMQSVSFAGHFIEFGGIKSYINDDGSFATGWRWIDVDGNGLCECYRFDANGILVTNTTIKDKEVNEYGQWVVDGEIQQVYKNSGRPYSATSKMLDFEDDNKYIDVGTDSVTRRINATKKEIKLPLGTDSEMMPVGPKGKFVASGSTLYGKGAKKRVESRPIATTSSWGIIADAMVEEEVTYLISSDSIVAGREMRRFITAKNKFTESSNNVKIYGGATWSDVMTLQGNGAYVKFSTTDPKSNKSKFRANYFVVEVAHQTHGESTADTYCAIEVYINGKSIDAFDDFCDGKPETIEMWLDDTDKTIELRAIVTGDAPGRKIYIRNARFRQIKNLDDKD